MSDVPLQWLRERCTSRGDPGRRSPGVTRAMLGWAFFFLLALLLMSFYGFWMATHPFKFSSPTTPAAYGWEYETVELLTRDGLLLRGWFIPRAEGSKALPNSAVIVLHGYPYDKGSILTVTPFLHEHFDLLLFDFRSFGESEGNVTTLGYREQEDLLAAIAFLQGRGVERIGVWGFSMGGAVGLMSLGRTSAIDALVADSSYADLEAMTLEFYRPFWVLKYPLAYLTRGVARLLLGVDPAHVAPVTAVEGSQVPVLVIHGEDDDQISVQHALRLQEALRGNPKAQSWLVPGARHGEALAIKTEEYEARVANFFFLHLRS